MTDNAFQKGTHLSRLPVPRNDQASWHIDVVGSFLRPAYLLEARQRGAKGDELRALEDRAILELLSMQEEIGLPVVTDGEFRRGHWTHPVLQIVDGYELIDGFPVPVDRLHQIGSLVDTEFAFLAEHTHRPVKITLPQPTALGLLWHDERSKHAYPTREDYVDAIGEILNNEARALASAGVAYIQLDAPQYTVASVGTSPAEYLAMVAADACVFDGVKGVMTSIHLCRGNYRRPQEFGIAPYDPYAPQVFTGFPVDRLLLEYDDYQAGDFGPLSFVPADKTVVLGLITTKWPEIEEEDELVARIKEASGYIPLERLAISPQCGFSPLATLQNVTPDVQRAKLELMLRVAERVWG